MPFNLWHFAAFFAVSTILVAPAAYGISFENQQGTISGSWDTTLSFGGPGGAFIEGRRALTQHKWGFDTSFTTFYGAGRQNETSDRDFIGANLKYTF